MLCIQLTHDYAYLCCVSSTLFDVKYCTSEAATEETTVFHTKENILHRTDIIDSEFSLVKSSQGQKREHSVSAKTIMSQFGVVSAKLVNITPKI